MNSENDSIHPENIRIEMLRNVRGIGLISKPGTILRIGEQYSAKTNPHGAISGLCNNGEYLGVAPGEFKFIDAPDWVLRLHRHDPGACSSCGLPISDNLPAHDTSLEPDHLGVIRKVCDWCWHHPALFFLPREIEIHGSERAVLEYQWRLFRGIDNGQTTLFSAVPDFGESIPSATKF